MTTVSAQHRSQNVSAPQTMMGWERVGVKACFTKARAHVDDRFEYPELSTEFWETRKTRGPDPPTPIGASAARYLSSWIIHMPHRS